MSTVSPEQLVTPRYCQVCGSPLIERYFDYEARTRLQCEGCGFVHYLNPRVVTAVIIEHGGVGATAAAPAVCGTIAAYGPTKFNPHLCGTPAPVKSN